MNWCLKSLLGLVPLIAAPLAHAAEPARLSLRDGDRIVLVGDTFIERDQKYGYLETLLTIANPDKRLEFRNLGWSGDTVYGDARAGFGSRPEGNRQLREHLLALKPTVVLIGYGMAESFDGAKGLPAFVKGLNDLLDVLAPTHAQIVLISPIAHEDWRRWGRSLPDPTQHNRDLALYVTAIGEVAQRRDLIFVDLFHRFSVAPSPSDSPQRQRFAATLTDNGIHLTDEGYWSISYIITTALTGEPIADWYVAITADSAVREARHTRISGAQVQPRGLKFEVTDDVLPPPTPRSALGGRAMKRLLKITGLVAGRYVLKIDGKDFAHFDATECAREGVTLRDGPEFVQVDRLRVAINEKNLLYFYRWRPQNETYLFGFRKHEQGNNAREIPLFDPLVAAKEEEIARLRVPATHVYEIIRESEEAR